MRKKLNKTEHTFKSGHHLDVGIRWRWEKIVREKFRAFSFLGSSFAVFFGYVTFSRTWSSSLRNIGAVNNSATINMLSSFHYHCCNPYGR